MKNEMPNWLKYLLIAIAIILIFALLYWIIENRKELHKQWLKKRAEIKALINERAKLIRKKLKLDRFATYSMLAAKCLIVLMIGMFSHFLVLNYKYDSISAFVTSAGLFGIGYTIICAVFFKKVYGINELHEVVETKIIKFIYVIGRLEPIRIARIEEELIKKMEEAHKIKKQLK
jgi:hypothetical protein